MVRRLACLLVIVACRKERATPAPPPDAAVDPEELALCREHYPCAPGQVYMCTIGAERGTAPEYSAPGLRIVRSLCRFAKQGDDDIVGIPPSGSPHYRGVDLFTRVQGTAAERARAAADLVAASTYEPKCEPKDEDGWLSFCTWGYEAPQQCKIHASGELACSSDGSLTPLYACRRRIGKDLIIAQEISMESSSGFKVKQPSDYALAPPGEGLGGPSEAVTIHAPGLRLRQAMCREPGPDYRSMDVSWGEDATGRMYEGPELIQRVDSLEARTSLALESLPDTATILSDPKHDAGLPPETNTHCELPPGPREANGIVVAYTYRSRSELRRCEIPTATWKPSCTLVKSGTFCLWDTSR